MTDPSQLDNVDVLVVGGGPGGYVAAIRAAKHDYDVALVDDDALGGTCLNYGCIPSKALLSAVDIAHAAGHQESMGIYADPYVDWAELLEWQDGVVDQLTDGVEHLCQSAGVELIAGRATFEDDAHALITDADGEEKLIAFDQTIIATGSRAIRLPGFPFDDERVLTSREVFSLSSIPSDLLIVGAGYIGLELATLFSKLGTDVTVVELENDVLPGWDDELRTTIRSHVASLGVEFAFGELANDCQVASETVRLTTETEDGTEATRSAERVVVAVGREPVTDTANLDTLDVNLTDRGFVEVDDQCRSSVDGVFAVGDVAGEPMLAHKASAEGLVAADTLAGEKASVTDLVIPSVVFTDPEVAIVGLSETEATQAGYETVTARMPFSASGRALTAGSADGFLRVVVDEETGALLGGQIIGEHASELVGELGLAVSAGLSAHEIADTVHAHPTLSEAIMEACAAAIGEAIHVPE